MEGQWTWTWQWLIGQLAKKKRAEHWEAVADVRLSPSHLFSPPPQDIAIGARLLATQLLCAPGPHPR